MNGLVYSFLLILTLIVCILSVVIRLLGFWNEILLFKTMPLPTEAGARPCSGRHSRLSRRPACLPGPGRSRSKVSTLQHILLQVRYQYATPFASLPPRSLAGPRAGPCPRRGRSPAAGSKHSIRDRFHMIQRCKQSPRQHLTCFSRRSWLSARSFLSW